MMRRFATFALLALSSLSGCFNPMTTRVPSLAPRDPNLERAESQVFDPFPSEQAGPETGVRPPSYQEQRPEPRRVKEQHYSGALRSRLQGEPVESPPGLGDRYPEVVR